MEFAVWGNLGATREGGRGHPSPFLEEQVPGDLLGGKGPAGAGKGEIGNQDPSLVGRGLNFWKIAKLYRI